MPIRSWSRTTEVGVEAATSRWSRPEIAIAVWPEHRGRGLGTRLLAALGDAARSAGIARLSLSVERENPAVRAYLRAGYETVAVPGNDYVMVARLD